MAAGAGAMAVLAAAFVVREDIAAWYVGYRFHWAPEGFEVRWVKPSSPGGEQLLVESEPGTALRGGVWSVSSGAIALIEPPPGKEWGVQPSGINATGHVVGALRAVDGTRSNRPFLWRREGAMQMLPAPGEGSTWFNDLNDRDQAVGSFEVEAPVSMQPIVSWAFLWTREGGFQRLVGLTELKTWSFSANGINESGWIAGVCAAQDGIPHPVIWPPPEHQPRDLGFLPHFNSGAAVDINERGAVLVNLWQISSGRYENTTPFLWTDERGFTALPVPPGYSSVYGVALGQHDTVLLLAQRGSGREEEKKSFLIRGGTLRELPGPRGATEVEYHGMSDSGWLVGTAGLREGPDVRRGFVAEPVR
jgi:hypothetical protein